MKNNQMELNCFFDGACAPRNPGGHIGTGAFINEHKNRIFTHAGYKEAHFDNSNNVAEYMALEAILDYIIKNKLINRKVNIFGDSQLVCMQMSRRWRIKEGRYAEYALRCFEKFNRLRNVRINWIPREENFEADELSNKEFVKRCISMEETPKQNQSVDFSKALVVPEEYHFAQNKGVESNFNLYFICDDTFVKIEKSKVSNKIEKENPNKNIYEVKGKGHLLDIIKHSFSDFLNISGKFVYHRRFESFIKNHATKI